MSLPEDLHTAAHLAVIWALQHVQHTLSQRYCKATALLSMPRDSTPSSSQSVYQQLMICTDTHTQNIFILDGTCACLDLKQPAGSRSAKPSGVAHLSTWVERVQKACRGPRCSSSYSNRIINFDIYLPVIKWSLGKQVPCCGYASKASSYDSNGLPPSCNIMPKSRVLDCSEENVRSMIL